jgi:hypothetical protein
MNTDVEELLREGMERFTTGVRAPAGLARTASRLHRRRRTVRAAVACATAAAAAAAAIAVTGVTARAPARGAQTSTVAYVLTRVKNAIAAQNLVYRGQTLASDGEQSTTWVYGPQSRWVEFSTNGTPYSVEGTAIVGGKRLSVYVLYPDRMWLVDGPGWGSQTDACKPHSLIGLAGIPIVTGSWSAFINQMLTCGNATVSGHALIGGVETTEITGKPVTVRMQAGEARGVREKWFRARWAIYVNTTTYLPVRITGSNESFGGAGGYTDYRVVTDVSWLPPTTANIASTLVTVPAGFQQVNSANDMP